MQTTLIGRLGPLATKAAIRLKELEIGQSVSVDEMSTLLEADCGPEGIARPNVRKAIDHIRRNDLINIKWFGTEKSWKRTNDHETALQTDEDRKRTRRSAVKGIERSRCVKVSALSSEDVAEFRATSTQLMLAKISLDNETRKSLPKTESVIDTERLLLSIRAVSK